MRGDAQFIADTYLIEKLYKIEIAAFRDEPFVKKAQIAGMLSGIASSLISTVKGMIDTSSTGSFIQSVLKILEPAVFFRMNPWLGILDTIGQTFFNISLTSIFSSIVSKLIPTISSGKQVTSDQVNEAGSSLLGSFASDDLLHELRMIEKRGEMMKIAFVPGMFGGQRNNRRRTQNRGFFGGQQTTRRPAPRSKGNILYNIFSGLTKNRGMSLLVGFLVWFLKTSLFGMGLLAVGGAAASLLGMGKKPKGEKPDEQEPTTSTTPDSSVSSTDNYAKPIQNKSNVFTQPPASRAPASPLVNLRHSGWGTNYMKNDARNIWVVPLGSRRPKDLLLEWTEAAYPQLAGYGDVTEQMPAFKRTLRLFRQNYTPGSNKLTVPPGYNRPIDIVNQYAGDVQRYITERGIR